MADLAATDVQTWDLERFFEGGAESEAYQTFVVEVAESIESLVEAAEALPQLSDVDAETSDWLDAWVDFLDRQQSIGERFHQAMSFARCMASANTNDPNALALPGRLQELSSRFDENADRSPFAVSRALLVVVLSIVPIIVFVLSYLSIVTSRGLRRRTPSRTASARRTTPSR